MTRNDLTVALNAVERGSPKEAARVLRAMLDRHDALVAAGGVDVTYTSGSAPATNGALTVADATTPTVLELLAFCEELNAKISALTADFA